MADSTSATPNAGRLVGQNYTTPDLVAKVTGKAKYAEDYRAEGMLWTKLLLSPMPHARVTRIDTSAALAMPGVKAILTADDLPAVVAGANLGEGIIASLLSERGLTMEPLYEGEPILAVAAVDEFTAAEAIEKIVIEFEPLPFVVDPIETLRPGGRECAHRRQRLGAAAGAHVAECAACRTGSEGTEVDRRGLRERPARQLPMSRRHG